MENENFKILIETSEESVKTEISGDRRKVYISLCAALVSFCWLTKTDKSKKEDILKVITEDLANLLDRKELEERKNG